MAHTQMPNIPGAAVMTDTLDFVKNLWGSMGSMGVPGLTAPTLSVEELDKKINDLKAVEAWLNLNMSMLRGTIQALEVQRGTIVTLKSVGASLAAAVNTSSDKSIFESNPYASAFFQQARPPEAAAAKPAPAPAPTPSAAAKEAKEAEDKPAEPAAATVWWNLLQEQFKQAMSTAAVSESMMADAAARATDTAVKFAAAASAGAKPAANTDQQAADGAEHQADAGKAAPAKPAAPKRAATKAGKPGADK